MSAAPWFFLVLTVSCGAPEEPIDSPLADTGEGDSLPGGFDLANADARLLGEGAGVFAGRALATGDVNGDGEADFLIGDATSSDNVDPRLEGQAHLVEGPVSGTRSLKIARSRIWMGYQTGVSVALWDMDGDGLDDAVVGTSAAEISEVPYGGVFVLRSPVALDAEGAVLSVWGEDPEDYTGARVLATDLDGDAFGDLLIGAPDQDAGGESSGAAYLVRGPRSGTMSLATADAKLVGEQGGLVGHDLAAQDVSGDGVSDLLLSASFFYGKTGLTSRVYVVDGPVSGTLDLAGADGIWTGEEAHSNVFVATGDGDGDGSPDVAVLVYSSVFTRVYWVADPTADTLDLADAPGQFMLAPSEQPTDVEMGDVDGDGVDDFQIAAPEAAPRGGATGAVYLSFGPVSGTVETWDRTLTGEGIGDGVREVETFRPHPDDESMDLLIGAPMGELGKGIVYLVDGERL